MVLFGRRRRRGRDAGRRPDPELLRAAVAHLERFVATRDGVEAYLEPPTRFIPATVILIGHDGEWTRRKMEPADVFELGHRLGIPVYDVARLGYPQRMRDYNARQRILRRRRGQTTASR